VTRFVWLQSRTQTLITAAALAALAVAAAITGIQLSHLYSSLVAHCQTGCGLATSQFLSHDRFMDHALDLLAQIAPALIGIFWGAPLVTRELETGTYQLAWTQSVSRSRWLVTKLAVVGFAAVTLAGLLTLTITWWYRALDLVGTNPYAVFDRRDIAPIGYAAFAFASGALIGAVIRRTLPAMATTLVLYVVARIATTFWVRPHLLSPITKTTPLLSTDQFDIGIRGSPNGPIVHLVAQGSGPANSWTLSSHVVNSSGHIPSQAELSAFVHQYCPTIELPPTAPVSGHTVSGAADPAALEGCRAQMARMFHLVVSYQPADRYWTFQWLETGVFFVLALLAAAGCYWWVTRRTN
jgi:ABC-type transport system involved in multi-copper enzyme maturation permease subunit